jgi:drug/metabolite transporter (DMT)-like permease
MRRDQAPPPVEVHGALLIVQLLFASLGVAGKIALRELSPFALIAFRTPLAALVFLGIRAAQPWERVAPRDLVALATQALFGIVINQLLFIQGLQRTTATNAVVIGTLIPVFTVGVALVLRHERATWHKLAGLAVAFAGAMTLVGAGRFEAGGERLTGNLCIVGNSLVFAIYLVISRPILARYSTLTVVAWTFAFGAIGVLPFGARDLIAQAPQLGWKTWTAALYIVALPTVSTYFLNGFALKRAPASLVAIYIYVQPFIGALLAAALLRERPTPATAVGGVLIGLGIWQVTLEARRQV